ncbi:MAG: DUF4307 domain-containing protein [Candidatus Planktophila sp.]|nr:DUF4307 domain-containing protein [Candidatus Planktophila sp.]
MSAEFSYNDRYGIPPRNRWLAPAIFFAVTGITWLLWAGLHHSNPPIRYSLISYSITSEKEISVRYWLQRRDKDAVVICTLIARDIDKNVVGQIDDEIEPGLASLERTTSVQSRGPAVNADVMSCRRK